MYTSSKEDKDAGGSRSDRLMIYFITLAHTQREEEEKGVRQGRGERDRGSWGLWKVGISGRWRVGYCSLNEWIEAIEGVVYVIWCVCSYVLVVEVSEQLDLPQDPLGVHQVIERTARTTTTYTYKERGSGTGPIQIGR